MAVLDWPDGIVPSKATWNLKSNTESFTSPLNGSSQTIERPGARWKVSLEFPPLKDPDRGRLEAFLAALNGMAGRFTIWPHGRPGSSPYSPLVNGTLTDFKSLPTKSWPASTVVLRAGDFLAVNGELKMVTADVTSDSSGLASVPVSPPFRKAPAANSVITLNKPRATMMLASDENGIAVVQGRFSDSVAIGMIEVFL